jgi:hemoglobin-like flavoprotein
MSPTTEHGPIDPAQARLLREQYALVAADAGGFTAGFYARLFTLAPLTRALFRQHMDTQGDRFMQMLGRLIAEADQPAKMGATIADLARLHQPHGLVPEDSKPVLEALCAELAARLGADFDAGAEAAWTGLYRMAVAPMFADSDGRDPDAV